MKYYRADIECNNKIYRLGIASENKKLSKEEIKDLAYLFLKSQKEHVIGNEDVRFRVSNKEEFNELKCEIELEYHFKESYRIRY